MQHQQIEEAPMQRIRITLVSALVGISLVPGGTVSAHNGEDVTPRKAGPIRRQETTMRQMRKWFGAPSSRKVEQVGCVKVIQARWGHRLMVYASRTEPRTVEATFIRRRNLTSKVHGDLALHTRRGLRVGNRERRLRALYPRARPETHAGHTHYRLRTGKFGAYLLAKVVDHKVVQLENWPFEFC
jgi:hypothetical protein